MVGPEYPRLILSDPGGNIFDHPSLKLSGRFGDRFFLPHPSELVPLPKGSQLFTLPGRIPIGWDEEKKSFISSRKARSEKKEVEGIAVAAFLLAVFRVTLLPGGAVLSAEKKKSSGNAAYDNAVERAILKSDPLPLPPDAALFKEFRIMELKFQPRKMKE